MSTDGDSTTSFELVDRLSSDSDPSVDDGSGHDKGSSPLSTSPTTMPTHNYPAKRAPKQRHDVHCQLCLEQIRGERYTCLECRGKWTVCTMCFEGVADEVHPVHTFIRVRSAGDIFQLPAESLDQIPMIHLDVLCSSCQNPILGERYECMADQCQDFNLCQKCEALPLSIEPHSLSHPLIKYSVPKEKVDNSQRLKKSQEQLSELRRQNLQARRLQPCRTFKWNDQTQSFDCRWRIENDIGFEFSQGCQVRRLTLPSDQSVNGVKLQIDDSAVFISHSKFSLPTIAVNGLKVLLPAEVSKNNDMRNEKEEAVKYREIAEPVWFSETWMLVDGEGRPIGENYSCVCKFLCFVRDDGTLRLIPDLARVNSEAGERVHRGEAERSFVSSKGGIHIIELFDR